MNSFNDLYNQLSSSSSSTNSGGAAGGSYSEPEVKLASKNPKKRAGRKKFKETRHPVYRGVRSRDKGRWVCEVRHPVTQSRVWLGTHPTAEMAARAHDVAVLALRGPSACLNFADSVWRLPVPESKNVSDIQKTAAEAAGCFRDTIVMKNDDYSFEINESPENVAYVDEEDMPGFLDSMAEALMVPPPQTVGYGYFMDDVEFCDDVTLWNF
ncbi:dehydration-responsive element-binding protein 1E-like [Rutidosis leptorrhynchoides]|uniref:dehydration-responsive element-binding protein 1E-like n=1 Tax=Rutidosis leptorrhynchoides TaxID=125765 RepID=UPI003A99B8B8